jgi:uncharacterized protein DUF992
LTRGFFDVEGLIHANGEIVMTVRVTCFSAIAAAALMAAASTGAQANVEVGGLTCRSPGAVGFVVGSTLNFQCVFVPSGGGPQHHYVGVIRRIGVDLGVTQNVSLGWAVFAPTGVLHPGDLAGNYGGVQGNASVGLGVGANALVGGSNNSIALQPVSAEAQTGLNVSAGLTDLQLTSVDRPLAPHVRHHRRHH